MYKYFEDGGREAIIHFNVGQLFRNLAEEDTVMGKWTKKLLAEGALPPDWIALTLWVNEFKSRLLDNKQIAIIDGTPRRLIEAKAFDELLMALDRPPIIPIYLDIDEKESIRRNIKRGRADADENITKRRLEWFKTDVVPVLNYWKDRFIIIDGNGSKGDVWKRLVKKLEGRK